MRPRGRMDKKGMKQGRSHETKVEPGGVGMPAGVVFRGARAGGRGSKPFSSGGARADEVAKEDAPGELILADVLILRPLGIGGPRNRACRKLWSPCPLPLPATVWTGWEENSSRGPSSTHSPAGGGCRVLIPPPGIGTACNRGLCNPQRRKGRSLLLRGGLPPERAQWPKCSLGGELSSWMPIGQPERSWRRVPRAGTSSGNSWGGLTSMPRNPSAASV